MNEEGSPICIKDDVNTEELIPKENFFKKNKKLVIIFAIAIVVLIIVIIFAIISVFSKKDSGNKSSKIFGDIICVFNVKSELEPTKILGDSFQKKSEFKIIIHEFEIKYSKQYQFSKPGINSVRFSLLEEINMDNMFKKFRHFNFSKYY